MKVEMTREELHQRQMANMHSRIVAEGVELVRRAREFAIKAHGDQRYGDDPYVVHLDEADSVLIEFNHISSILRAAILLHDVVEDTAVTIEEVQAQFPGYTALIVEAVTSEPGKNRKERNAKTYPKIKQLKYAIIAKLADRIANVRRSIKTSDSKLQMYTKEYPAFREALFVSDIETLPMWWELDRLLDYHGV